MQTQRMPREFQSFLYLRGLELREKGPGFEAAEDDRKKR